MKPSLEEVLDVLKAEIERGRTDAGMRAEAIKSALDRYVLAVEHQLIAALATRNGVPVEAGESAREVAEELFELVSNLPELPEDDDEEDQEVPRPTASVEIGHSAKFVLEAGPEARELHREVVTLDFDGMPANLFRVYAAELAARARSLQQRGLEAEDIPGRVIRRVTKAAYSKGVRSVFGLRRQDQATSWDEIASQKKIERERIESRGLSGPEASSAPSEATRQPSVQSEEDEDDHDGECAPLSLPALRARAEQMP
jgi:hypothetical protein